MKSKDRRERRIVYVSGCILNQNLRFPGIAVAGGAVRDIIEPLIENGLGIEQLPCLERMGWGGVSRRTYFRFQPIVLRLIDSRLSPIVRLFAKLWILNFKKLCRKEAKRVVDRMEDYIGSGYSISGIIAMNDSPTCGATKTIDLLESAAEYKRLGLDESYLKDPDIDKMKIIIPGLLRGGSGLFMAEVIKELEKRKMNIDVIGFDPWSDLKGESDRIAEILNLKRIKDKGAYNGGFERKFRGIEA